MSHTKPMRTGHNHFGWPEWLVLLLYTGWVCLVSTHHEPWIDEAQSWLLARDCGFSYLQFTRLHYEGTPGLWTALLWVLSHAGAPYAAMHWLTGLAGVACTVLILRFAPFPRWLRWFLPFCVAFVYQGPIIARSYSLAIVFILALAALYRSPRGELVWTCVFCVLLADSSLFGLSIAFGFASLFARKAWLIRGRPPLAFAAVLLVSFTFSAWQAIPAPDLSFGVANKLTARTAIAHALATMTHITAPPPEMPEEPANPLPTVEPVFHHAWQQRLWHYTNVPRPYPITVALTREVIFCLSTFTYVISDSVLFAILFYVVLVIWLWHRRQLTIALPLFLMALTGWLLRFWDHHLLMLWAVIVATLWMAWPEKQEKNLWQQGMLALLTVVIGQQVLWGAACSWRDFRRPFDSSQQLTAFLKEPQQRNKRIAAVNLYPVATQPYFKANPFFNEQTRWWHWQLAYDPDRHLSSLLGQHPDIIINGETFFGDASVANQLFPNFPQGAAIGGGLNQQDLQLAAAGWRNTKRFCGQQPQHLGYGWQMCTTVWVPPALATASAH